MDILKWVRDHHQDLEVVVLTGVGDVEMVEEAMKLGAYDYLTKPASEERLVFTIRRALERVEMRRELTALRSGLERSSLGHPGAFSRILTRSPKMLSMLMKVEQIAPTEGTVLMWGEGGTGKGLVARSIHDLSKRSEGPFVAVNAGVVAAELFAREFFGHEEGAFTGARARRLGKVEAGSGGTLLLDEVGRLPIPVQAKVVGLLENGTFERHGGDEVLESNVRLIASTAQDLQELVTEGVFREDLSLLLGRLHLELPPLRERDDDIPQLVTHFAQEMALHMGIEAPRLSSEADEVLRTYRWPGNVRELQSVVQRAVANCRGSVVQRDDLGL